MLERVLYIDDDEAMPELAELVSEAADIEMMTCSPGPDALQLAKPLDATNLAGPLHAVSAELSA